MAVLVLIGLVVAGLVDGFGQESSAESTVQGFLLAWQQHDYRQAASYTSGSAPAVSGALADAFTQLDATSMFLSLGRIDQHGDTAVAHFTASVNLGPEGHQWTYGGQFQLRKLSAGWKVQWAPSVINPQLGPGERLAVVTKVPSRAPVLDAEGQPLQVPSVVYKIGVWPKSLAHPDVTAADFAGMTQLNSIQVLGQIQAAPPGQFLTLLSLDPASYARMAHHLAQVPGLAVHRVSQRLFSSNAGEVVGAVGAENAGVLRDEGAAYQPGTTVGLSGLQAAYQRMLAGSPTTNVIAEDSRGHQVGLLREWPGEPARPVRTTISAPVQSAAAAALGAAPDAAAELVAVDTTTGKILAVAGHSAPGARLPAGGALNAHLTPGTAFTIVSTAALLGTGVSANAEIPCTSVADVGGRQFTAGQLASTLPGNTSFSTDFAQGCGTAFAGLSRRLTSSSLSQVASGFGIGANWQLPLSAYSGSVPAATGDGQLAAETIGNGVQMSPLGMALVAAEVQSGVARSPVLVTDPPDGSAAKQSPLTPGALTSLRQLMRKAVTSGSAQSADVPGSPVYGQTALVQVGSGASATWQSWFVGFRGDVAFAILESDSSPQVSASFLAAQFLNALQVSH
ncbi:MAG TPA: penicillin-binding transpeptidase domain-containing protein [Solirubrobacteraceae bacterium]|nr:penicillin-binding transpeptidase domain-containing protein [Solirubrobacteraceae bacterium]